MQKTMFASVATALFLLSAGFAAAQSYGGCANITQNLSRGMRGADVSALQSFLVAQNYPGGGSWMVTGFFGTATQAAVINFQSQHGLAQTGFVDAPTRAAMNMNCGGGYANNTYGYSPVTSYPYSYNTPVTYSPVVTNNAYPYNYSNGISISALSVTSGPVGASVTIYGTGFDPLYNTVYFGNSPVSGTIASNGTSLTFTVPSSYTPTCSSYNCYTPAQYTSAGSYQVYVSNTHGISNSLSFLITSGNVFGCAPYGGFGGCGGYGSTYGTPTISYMNPTSGAVGDTVTILGSGFSARNNSIHFGPGIITGLTSVDGASLTFLVPSALTGFGSQALTLGTYNVSASNEQGVTSNAVPFTLTSVSQNSIAPTIVSINGPSTITTGATGTWTVTVSNQASANATLSVRWGDENLYPSNYVPPQTMTTSGQQTFTFTHTYQTAGTYSIAFTVTNNAGLQNSMTATVVVSSYGSQNTLTLGSLQPTTGRVGTLVTLTGTGFTQGGNTVHFGVGGTANVTSTNNGTTIYYTIPYTVSACDLVGAYTCGAPATLVSPGSYPIYITNAAGQSTMQTFTVTQ